MPTHPLPVLRVVRGGASRIVGRRQHAPAPDSTRRYFLNAIRDSFLAMTVPLRRAPTPAWYELSRAKARRQSWGSNLLTHLSEAIDAQYAEGKIDRAALVLVPELIIAFIDMRLAELPGSAESDMLEDYSRRAA